MNILAFDTATAACSAAVMAGGRIVAHRFELREAGHAEHLMPMVEAVMEEAGLGYRDLDRIAVTVGPGTFTGLRIGLAAARGLAIAADIPVLGVSTLETLAATAFDMAMKSGATVIAAIDARRGEVYAQAFEADGNPASSPAVLSLADAAALAAGKDTVLVGTGATLLAPLIEAAGGTARCGEGPGLPDAGVLAEIAARRAIVPGVAPPAPLYLRAPDARLPATAPQRWPR
ncbi:MAG: tRNA (adenosine(37)-N6)-threonylcarbamoyltransferase complex dimerization subunit type 1 TsaB [Rhodospirillaceae bacterium]|nr:tRNA (adenosine(37)-N6)-threonylcarbamoyltransferase complex dimerization subunit type 1 TsaB [Rhodospirillaceae bacterium]